MLINDLRLTEFISLDELLRAIKRRLNFDSRPSETEGIRGGGKIALLSKSRCEMTPARRGLTRHRLGGGVGSDPPPPRFFRNNFFIYYCIDMKLGTPLWASIWRRIVQRKSKSAVNFLLWVEFCDVTSRDFGPIKGKGLEIHQK